MLDKGERQMAEGEERFGRVQDIELRSIAGEHFLIVLHAGEAKMFTLNEMGLWFWRQLEQPASKAELLGRMLRDYEVTDAIAIREIDRFLAYLESKRLACRL